MKKAWQKDIERHMKNIRLQLENLACNRKPPERVTQYFVSMCKGTPPKRWSIQCKNLHWEWDMYNTNEELFNWLRDETIPGLQPGMLCLAEKEVKAQVKRKPLSIDAFPIIGDSSMYYYRQITYKIVEVLEINLDIDVDWRKCPLRVMGEPCSQKCPPQSDKYCYAPYLPNTDIQIDVDFNEKKTIEQAQKELHRLLYHSRKRPKVKPDTETPTEFFDRICKPWSDGMPNGILRLCFCDNRTGDNDAEQLRQYKALFKEEDDDSHEAHVKAWIEYTLGISPRPRLRLCYKHEQPKLITGEILEAALSQYPEVKEEILTWFCSKRHWLQGMVLPQLIEAVFFFHKDELSDTAKKTMAFVITRGLWGYK